MSDSFLDNLKEAGKEILNNAVERSRMMNGIPIDGIPADDWPEYDEIQCKEATISAGTILFPLIFGIPFGGVGILVLKEAFMTQRIDIALLLFGLVFLAVGLFMAFRFVHPIVNRIILMTKGKEIDGILQCYYRDNVRVNGRPLWVARIIVDSQEGKKYLIYQTGKMRKKYADGSIVHLKIYRDIALLLGGDTKREKRIGDIW